MTYLAEGDLPGARAALGRDGKAVEPDALVAYLANYYDLVWVLDPGQTEILSTPHAGGLRRQSPPCGPSAQAQARRFAGRCRQACAIMRNEARQALEEQLRSAPDDPQLHAVRGLALAYLGRKDEALREGERGVALGGPEGTRRPARTCCTSSCGSRSRSGSPRRRSSTSSSC